WRRGRCSGETSRRPRHCPQPRQHVAPWRPHMSYDAAMQTGPANVPHVLALDDDPAVRQMVADYLSENELRVTAVATGKELSAVMAREDMDLVVLDVRLQGEDGMQIARKLREASGIPILMLTGRAEEADRVMGLELGAEHCLTKHRS